MRPSFRALTISCTGALTLLVGCSRAGLMKTVVSPQDAAAAESYVNLLREQKFDAIQNDMSPDLQTPDARGTLADMAALFPSQGPTSVKVVGAQTVKTPDQRSTTITVEYEFPGKWLLASVTTQESSETRTITGFDVQPISDSLEDQSRFNLKAKTELQYDTLIMAVLSVLFTLYAFILCLRTKFLKLKWLWLIVTLVGVGTFAVNWSTGGYAVTLLSFHVPAAGAAAPLYGPWVVYVAVPVGAAIFLSLRKRLTKAAVMEESSARG